MDDFNDFENQNNRTVVLNGTPINSGSDQVSRKSKNIRPAGWLIFLIAFVIVIAAYIINLIPSEKSVMGNTAFKPVFSAEDSAKEPYTPEDYFRGTVHYSQMEYVRPDIDGIFEMIEKIEDTCEVVSPDNIADLLDNVYAAYWDFDTMYTLADLRSCIDTTDTFYQEECGFFSEYYPLLDQKLDEMLTVLAESSAAGYLDENYYESSYLSSYASDFSYSNELIALYQRESDLIYRYQYLVSYPTVTIDGEEHVLYDYLYDNWDDDDKYYGALSLYYDQHIDPAGEIYIELVKTRRDIAQLFGYDSYADYAYDNLARDYSHDEMQEYIHDICLGAVPAYKYLYENGEIDENYYNGYLSEDRNFSALKNACGKMGPEISEIFSYMETYGLYDIEASDVKLNNSFQIYLEKWEAPFIMLYPYLSPDDYIAFAHEFGHFVDAYLNYNYNITTDATETCSQAMEYLAAVYADIPNVDFVHMKMVETVQLYAEQGAYNAFEEAVYSLPESELTVERLNRLYHDISLEYGIISEGDDDYGGKSWIDVYHFFSNPYYIVSYIVAADPAYQIFRLEIENPGDGVSAFLALADRSWDDTYLETIENIGLDASFTSEKAAGIIGSLNDYFMQ